MPRRFFLSCALFYASLCVQTLILSHALEDDVLRGFAEIQKSVATEHVCNEVLNAERDAHTVKVKDLEGRAAGFEEECASL